MFGVQHQGVKPELQTGHQNGQDMSHLYYPLHREVLSQRSGSQGRLRKVWAREPLYGSPHADSAGGSPAQPNVWLCGPTSPLFPCPLGPASSQRRVGERRQQITRRVGVTLSLTCSVMSSKDCQAKKTFPLPISSPKATPSTSVGCPQWTILPHRQEASGEGITVRARISLWTHCVMLMGCYKPASFIPWSYN